MEKDRGGRRFSDVTSVSSKRNIRDIWETAIQARFAKELGEAEDVSAMVDLGRMLKDMAGRTWQESSWREGWTEDDAMIVDKGMLVNPADFLGEIQATIRDLKKQQ